MKLSDRRSDQRVTALGVALLVVLIPAVVVLNVWWIRHTWN